MAPVLSDTIEELRTDVRHGGSWTARVAVEALVTVAEQPASSVDELLERLIAGGRELAASRPGVAAVAGAVGRLLASAKREAHLPLEEFRRVITAEATGLVDARRRAAASIAIQLREWLEDSVVVTHSASATVREALTYTPPKRVVCTVTRPHEEGRLLAEELSEGGLEAEVVDDEEAEDALDHATLLLVGADTVYRCGTLLNKIGTRRLADAAAARNVPVVVAAEVIKLAPFDLAAGPKLEDPASELFDLTPPELIELVVTEEGAYPADEIRALVDRTPFLREGYALLGKGIS